MGGESEKQENFKQTTKSEPWEVTREPLMRLAGRAADQLDGQGLSPVEHSAYSELESNARAGNPWAPAVGLLATDLFKNGRDRTGMVTDTYGRLERGLTPYTEMDTNPYSNPAFAKAAGFMSDDIMDRVKSQYAGAGYNPTSVGDFAQSVGEGISRGVAPAWLQAHNDMEARKVGAIQGLYGAGNTSAGLLAGMDQAALDNRVKGIDVAKSALLARDSPAMRLLELEQGKWAVPMQRLAGVSDVLVPMAKSFGVQNAEGQRNTTMEMSPAEQAWGWMNAFANLGRSFGGGGRGGGSWGSYS